VMLAKVDRTDRKNNEKYALFGDPAMRLCAPQYRAVIDSIDPDSIQALSTMSISGHVEDAGKPLSDYDGKILLRVLDTRKAYVYKSPSRMARSTSSSSCPRTSLMAATMRASAFISGMKTRPAPGR